MFLLAGIFGAFAAFSAIAVPFGITFSGGVPLHYWGCGWAAGGGLQDLHIVSIVDTRPPVARSPASQLESAHGQASKHISEAHSPASDKTTASAVLGGSSYLAGMGFVVLLLVGRKFRPAKNYSHRRHENW